MQNKPANFLINKELQIFKTEKRYFRRFASVIKNSGEIVGLKKDFESVFPSSIREHLKSDSSFKLITVEINETDGMSWLSQKIFDINSILFGTFSFFNIDNTARDIYKLPSIAYVIGKKSF